MTAARRFVPDAIVAGLLFVVGAAVCARVARWDPSVYHAPTAQDIWFDGDTGRVFWVEADRASKNDRTALHPLQRLVSYPPVLVLKKTARLTSEDAVRYFHSAIAGLWLAGLFVLLRAMACARLDALVFTGVAATSAAALFWLPVTESWTLGSLSMFPALMLAARPSLSTPGRHFLALVASLGITLTNGMAGLFSAFASLRRRTFLLVAVAAVAAAALGVVLDGLLFPGTRMIPGAPMDEAAWMFSPDGGGPLAVLRVFFVSGMVAPELRFLANWKQPIWPVMTMQFGGLLSGGRWSWIATPVWLALLALGAAALLRNGKRRPALTAALGLTVLYQLVLHLWYGREIFLYAIHFTPLLVAVAASAARTRLRPAALALGLVLIVANLGNNAPAFAWAKRYTTRHLALKALEGKTYQPVHESSPPELTYRFWKTGSRP